MPGEKKKKKPTLKVVFDTNVLYTGAAHYLVRREVREFIDEFGRNEDITVRWILPEVVVGERAHQMNVKGISLLPHIKKVESLLRHKLNINEEILKERVLSAIDRELKSMGAEVVPVDTDKVDWQAVINASCERIPPFEEGEKEKGFRDAVFLETFVQIVQNSPSTPRVCRVIAVTEDEVLQRAIESRATEAANVRIFDGLDQLRGLINTISGDIKEEFVAEILPKAVPFFFEVTTKTGAYYNLNVRDRINEEFGSELIEVPQGASIRENGTWYINRPNFVMKRRQRVTFSTKIDVQATCYVHQKHSPTVPLPPAAGLGVASTVGSMSGYSTSAKTGMRNPYLDDARPSITFNSSGGSWGEPSPTTTRKVKTHEGHTSFKVVWSVSISEKKQSFSRARVETVEYKGTDWDDAIS